MNETDMEKIVMELVVHGGDARSKAIEAIDAAKEGDFDKANHLIKMCNETLSKTHNVQTDMIQAEVRGDRMQMSLLMVHAQDHLMNAITVRDMASEFIELYKRGTA